MTHSYCLGISFFAVFPLVLIHPLTVELNAGKGWEVPGVHAPWPVWKRQFAPWPVFGLPT